MAGSGGSRTMTAVAVRLPVVIFAALLVAVSYVGWRSTFVGGWHSSGDGSYECPDSPWHTVLHPLRPELFGDAGPIAAECNRDAKRVVVGWAVAEAFIAGLTVVVAVASARTTAVDDRCDLDDAHALCP